jgi:hypothetical protein
MIIMYLAVQRVRKTALTIAQNIDVESDLFVVELGALVWGNYGYKHNLNIVYLNSCTIT